MLKINYPKDRKAFEETYLEVFKKLKLTKNHTGTIEDKFQSFLRKNVIFRGYLNKLKEDLDKKFNKPLSYFECVLVAPFENLHTILFEVNQSDPNFWNNKDNKNELKKIFNYDKKDTETEKFYIGIQREKIAKFFIQQLNISTCYFCNIDYINSFRLNAYYDKLDFMQNADRGELVPLINGMSEASEFFVLREKDELISSKNETDFLEKLKIEKFHSSEKIIKQFKELNFEELKSKSQFTLDHLIDKGDFPLLGLSLYNFVPSCYTCNSKLKGTDKLIALEKDKSRFSPTSENFKFDKDVKFILLYSILDKLKLKTQLSYSNDAKDYEKYETIFRLNGRYDFHKKLINDLIEKSKKYPPSRIKEMARLLKMSPEKIKKDIFGEEIFDDTIKPEAKPFTKLKRDIAEQIGLL